MHGWYTRPLPIEFCCYRLKGVTGNVYVNGSRSNIKQLTKKSSYIMQDDKLQQLLTIEEAMMFAANVKLRANLRAAAKRATVSISFNFCSQLLRNFSLSERRLNKAYQASKISVLRVNVARKSRANLRALCLRQAEH